MFNEGVSLRGWRVRFLLLVSALALAWESAQTAEAAESRYGLFIGARNGAVGEVSLRYAHRDAKRLADTLTSIGGWRRENVTVLEEPSPSRVRDALARINLRIRREKANGTPTLLFVYYSGHADALSLHLGRAELPWEELRNTTAGSSADVRILVVDTCRSGNATQVKGTQLDRPFAIPSTKQLNTAGFAILASTTAGEDAQESDSLQASFFTHHLIFRIERSRPMPIRMVASAW